MTMHETLNAFAALTLACAVLFSCSGGYDNSGTGSGAGGGADGSAAGGSASGAGGSTHDGGDVTTECRASCAKFSASTCQDKPASSECDTICDRMTTGLTNNTDCAPAWAALFACQAAHEVTCSETGKPGVVGCETVSSAATNCIAKYAGHIDCNASCAKMVPPSHCGVHDYKNEQDCKLKCATMGHDILLTTACWDQYKDLVACEATYDAQCMPIEGGYVFRAMDCVPKYQAVIDCLPQPSQ